MKMTNKLNTSECLACTLICVNVCLYLGMFPYVMLATTPLFYAYDWPRRALARITCTKLQRKNSTSNSDTPAAAAATTTSTADDDDANDDDGGGGGGDDEDISRNTSTANTTNKVCRQNDSKYYGNRKSD